VLERRHAGHLGSLPGLNRTHDNVSAPAGFLLGFMRRWRKSPGEAHRSIPPLTPEKPLNPRERDLLAQIKAAPSINRQFHASDLCRAIGQAAYDAQVLDAIKQFACPKHGQVVLGGEISR